MPKEITVKNFRKNRKFGWGWSTTPTGEDAYSIETPDAPDYEGTLNQLQEARRNDRAFNNLGGAFFNTAWFYRGKRITHTRVFGPMGPTYTEYGEEIEDVEYDDRWEPKFNQDTDDKDITIRTE